MNRECELGKHEYRPVHNWWECARCGVSNNFKPMPGHVATEIATLREKLDVETKEADRLMGVADDYWKRIEELEKRLEEYEKSPVEAFTSSPFVGTKGLGEIIDLLATYYPIPVAGQHYAAHLKYEFAQLRKQRKDAEAADELEHNRANGWEAEGACDACGGMGGIIDCMCQGSGRAKDAVIFLREEVYRLQDMLLRRDRYRSAVTDLELLNGFLQCRYMHGPSPCMKCGFPGWDHFPKKEYEGYQAKWVGDCGFCGVCANCKGGRT